MIGYSTGTFHYIGHNCIIPQFSHAATSVQAALPFFLSRQSCDRETSSGANRVIKQGLKHHHNGEMGIAQSYYTQLFRGRNQNLDQLGTVEYSFG